MNVLITDNNSTIQQDMIDVSDIASDFGIATPVFIQRNTWKSYLCRKGRGGKPHVEYGLLHDVMNNLSTKINKSASRNIIITIEYYDHKGIIQKLMLKATMNDVKSGIIIGSFDEEKNASLTSDL
ncbi:MAG TPA: hypothetical protein PK941_10185 [Paludibacter sp.]|nr:hypothetical protein [Paludibacter sp.]